MNYGGMRRKEVYNRAVDLYGVSVLGRAGTYVGGLDWGMVVCRWREKTIH